MRILFEMLFFVIIIIVVIRILYPLYKKEIPDDKDD